MCAVFVRIAVPDCLGARAISGKVSRLGLWMIRVCTNRSTKFGLPTRNHGTRWILNCRSSRNTRRGNKRHSKAKGSELIGAFSHAKPNGELLVFERPLL